MELSRRNVPQHSTCLCNILEGGETSVECAVSVFSSEEPALCTILSNRNILHPRELKAQLPSPRFAVLIFDLTQEYNDESVDDSSRL